MKQYPSIPSSRDRNTPFGQPCVGFYKYDGSNLRWEWSRKKGFYKFGTRHRLFGADEAPFNEAIPIFMDTVAPHVEKAMLANYKGITEFTVYTEFWGHRSFAGSHETGDPKRLTLIDVDVYKKGIIPPKEFLKIFSALELVPIMPLLIYNGNFNHEVIESVRNSESTYLNEGAVFKGVTEKGRVWMVKVKTWNYLRRLRDRFVDWEKYAE